MSLLKSLTPALKNKIYFNYGGQGPLPTPTLDAIIKSWEKIQELGPFTNNVWPYISRELASTRNVLAEACGVAPHRISLTENVTSGCVLPLLGLPFSEGDRILISDCEHPGILAACKELSSRKKLEIDFLPVKQLQEGKSNEKETSSKLLNLLEESLTSRTRLVVLSHILWNTGQVMPIQKVKKQIDQHPNDPFLLVDAAQSFGQLPIANEAPNADIYGFTGHKWSLGPEGLGGVVLSERVLYETNPVLIGWRSLKNENSFCLEDSDPFHKDSRRFEVATSCIPLMAGLRTSLKLLEEEGTSQQRFERILSLSKKLWEGFSEINGLEPILKGSPPSGLVSFLMTNGISPKQVVEFLGSHDLWIRSLDNPPCLRACVHITSNEEEIQTLLSLLKKLTN